MLMKKLEIHEACHNKKTFYQIFQSADDSIIGTPCPMCDLDSIHVPRMEH